MDAAIPVTVVTGFLGAGKSTLLERWLGELPREGTAVIINEQGQVGIDGDLLAARAARLREITGGCVCCRAQGELDAALAEFADAEPRPTRILVETSGAASPAGVIRALTWGSARDRLRLDGVVTVLDASRAEVALTFDLTVEQLGFADVVVLSHADACEAQVLATLETDLGRYAPGASFVRGHRGMVEGDETLLEILAKRGEVLHPLPPPEHHAQPHRRRRPPARRDARRGALRGLGRVLARRGPGPHPPGQGHPRGGGRRCAGDRAGRGRCHRGHARARVGRGRASQPNGRARAGAGRRRLARGLPRLQNVAMTEVLVVGLLRAGRVARRPQRARTAHWAGG